jgi:hypothetical protein
MRRRRGLVGTLLAALGLVTAAGASVRGAEVGVENLRVGFANSSQNNLFKVGAWTPVRVQLKGGDERFAGTMEIEVPDDDGTPTFFRTPVEVPARGSVTVTAYARPGSRDPNFLIRLRSPSGRRVGPVADGSTLAQLSPVLPGETLLLALGKPSGGRARAGPAGVQHGSEPGQRRVGVGDRRQHGDRGAGRPDRRREPARTLVRLRRGGRCGG